MVHKFIFYVLCMCFISLSIDPCFSFTLSFNWHFCQVEKYFTVIILLLSPSSWWWKVSFCVCDILPSIRNQLVGFPQTYIHTLYRAFVERKKVTKHLQKNRILSHVIVWHRFYFCVGLMIVQKCIISNQPQHHPLLILTCIWVCCPRARVNLIQNL